MSEMRKISSGCVWIIIESGTGYMDGCYRSRKDAEEVMKVMHEERPQFKHSLARITAIMDGTEPHMLPPDHLFYARMVRPDTGKTKH